MNSHNPDKKNNRSGGRGWRVLDGGEGADGVRQLCSVEAEEYLLGCCLIDGAGVLAKCLAAKLPAGAFYVLNNRLIYAALMDMHRRELSISVPVLAEEMKRVGQFDTIGGYAELGRIAALVPTTAQDDYFIAKVRELWGLRELVKFTDGVKGQCEDFTGDLPEMVNALRAKLESMYDWASVAGREQGVSQAQKASHAAEEAIAGRVDKSRWLTWGIPGFDEAFGCFDSNNEDWNVILAGLRSQGKSALARQIAVANLVRGKKGVIFNLETGATGWLQRAAALHAKVNLRLLDREPRKERLKAFRDRLKEQEGWMGERLWIFDDVFTIEDIEVKTREIHRACGGLDFIVVDYLQLVGMATMRKGMNREQEVSAISRRLMLMGKKLNITNLVLAQLSRKSADEVRRPRISDLRESGAIEQDASRVVMIFIPPEGKAGKQDERTAMPECEIIQGKYKNGPTGYEPALFEKPFTLFLPAVQRGEARPGTVASAAGYKREGQS